MGQDAIAPVILAHMICPECGWIGLQWYKPYDLAICEDCGVEYEFDVHLRWRIPNIGPCEWVASEQENYEFR